MPPPPINPILVVLEGLDISPLQPWSLCLEPALIAPCVGFQIEPASLRSLFDGVQAVVAWSLEGVNTRNVAWALLVF